ncbi:MAG TPA: DUF1992 domain-containing protein [Thermomicrobiales bacterium]|nr:DUF1992 domain-containing protein [Thermomicrobiales bacterium]
MNDEDLTTPVHRRPLHLQDWDSWLDKTIAQAEQRGDFANLPGHGKPLRFDANPLTGEIDVGHGLLKSAGMAPAWIELDKEIRAGLDALATLRDETFRRLTALATRPTGDVLDRIAPNCRPWWRALLGRSHTPGPTARQLASRRLIESERTRARAAYLEHARALDTKIASFNAALPSELWHLERPRLTPERAAQDFDAACPAPIDPSGES